MLDIGWPELVVIAVVALVVIGPKDLPKALYTVGKWVRKARLLAREFQGNIDEMVRQAELDDLRKQVNEVRGFNMGEQVKKAIDPAGDITGALSMDDLGAAPRLFGPDPGPAAPVAPPATPAAPPAAPAATQPGIPQQNGAEAGQQPATVPPGAVPPSTAPMAQVFPTPPAAPDASSQGGTAADDKR
ncbi:MAG TPA: Sec-independent protein translocase protein TatB [Azospirillaceae bacterium]|nr:Sec-independent protein translocase protein TatB [Azospirillaceae bacterium]